MKKTNTAPILGITLTFLTALTPASLAAVVIVDPVDSTSLEFEVNGISSQASLTNALSTLVFSIQTNSRIGRDSSGSFTTGTFLTPSGVIASVNYRFNSAFSNNASEGLNYARLDIGADGIFETVVELDFGPDPAFTGDVITRYAFDDTGSSLDIPDAFNPVPEPGTITLTFLGFAGLFHRKRKI